MTRPLRENGAGCGFVAPPPSAPLEALAATPTFSIVIPAYQAAGTIGGAVRSALDQVRPPHEIIIVDDGSSDDLQGAVREFQGRITLIRKENGGAPSALNAGAAVASGDFLAVLDADDAYHRRRLDAFTRLAIARPDLDVLATDARFVVDGEAVGCFYEHNRFVVEDQRAAILGSCFFAWPAVRLTRLRAIGGFDEALRFASDWDCWLRLVLDGALVGLVDEPYYDYRLHGGSLSSSRVASLWERVRLLEKAALDPGLSPDERQVLTVSLRSHRTRAVLAEARARTAGRHARKRLLRFALSGDIEQHARIGVALAATAPGLARRLIRQDSTPEGRFRAHTTT